MIIDFLLKNEHNIVFICEKFIENNQISINIRGTGFIIKKSNKQFVITCAHIYEQIPEPKRTSISCGIIPEITKENVKSYNLYDLEIAIQNKDRDICIFELKEKNILPNHGFKLDELENDLSHLRFTDDVIFMGYPLANEFLQMNMGITLTASQTIISSIKFNSQDKKIDFIIIDKLVNPGSSGSPVFLNNKIIGIASNSLNYQHRIGETLINIPVNIGLIRPSLYIVDLLNSIK